MRPIDDDGANAYHVDPIDAVQFDVSECSGEEVGEENAGDGEGGGALKQEMGCVFLLLKRYEESGERELKPDSSVKI
ncbi:hypothetical protein EYF80_016337 [Liparis tanakae]|uniref:Uncharacterized protein n=1 Tax=Liparis tanakae TaxID=230148 RepID=A0A4Z2I8F4_9TELE|nr:hypothetical protein EYF80_016337 [Liparis tanakae]